jgi:tetratricopeptide (TPR) repeat protein
MGLAAMVLAITFAGGVLPSCGRPQDAEKPQVTPQQAEIANQARQTCRQGLRSFVAKEYKDALSSFRMALELWQNVPNSDKERADCHALIGGTLAVMGRGEEAAREDKKALAMYEKLGMEKQATAVRNAISAEEKLAAAQKESARAEADVTAAQQKLDKMKADLAETDRKIAKAEKDVAKTEEKLNKARAVYQLAQEGAKWVAAGENEKALNTYRAALALCEDVPEWAESRADFLVSIATSLTALGRHEEAAEAYRKALASLADLPGREGDRADCLLGLALELSRMGRSREAIKEAEKALDAYGKLPGKEEEVNALRGFIRELSGQKQPGDKLDELRKPKEGAGVR